MNSLNFKEILNGLNSLSINQIIAIAIAVIGVILGIILLRVIFSYLMQTGRMVKELKKLNKTNRVSYDIADYLQSQEKKQEEMVDVLKDLNSKLSLLEKNQQLLIKEIQTLHTAPVYFEKESPTYIVDTPEIPESGTVK